MKVFDIIGVTAVATWLVVSGFYVYRAEFDQPTQSERLNDNLVINEGETWL